MEQLGAVAGSFGAVLCDFEGEAIAVRLGPAPLPEGSERRLERHVPRSLGSGPSAGTFLLRLAGAEPCALLALFEGPRARFGAGPLLGLDLEFREAGVLARRLPEDHYVALFLGPTADRARARRVLEQVVPVLARELR